MVDPHDTFEVPAAGPGQTRHIARELLAHIIEQRVDEIFGLVAEQLAASGYGDRLGAGVVLTGGGASLAGVVELAENSFVSPVRCGVPGDGLGGLVDSVRRPKFASVAGLVLFGAQQLLSDTNAGTAVYSGSSVNGVFQWMRDWLTDFF